MTTLRGALYLICAMAVMVLGHESSRLWWRVVMLAVAIGWAVLAVRQIRKP